MQSNRELLIYISTISVQAHNEYNHKKEDIKGEYKEIKKEIRKLLKIDKIFVK